MLSSLSMTRLIDLTGKHFGMLTVIERRGSRPNGVGTTPMWLAKCDCGGEVLTSGPRLRGKQTRSCGCLLRPHGKYGTPEYNAWASMIQRCTNPNSKNWKNYGARGIKVCSRWMNSAAAFLKDMGPKPGPDYSLDRIDTNGNYEPGNCRWATLKEQSRNRRTARIITVEGRSATLAEWAEITGIGRTTIRERLSRGWSPERAIAVPV